MQKRLLALVATVAMVLSMFAGIAFAEAPAVHDSAKKTITVYLNAAPTLVLETAGSEWDIKDGDTTVDFSSAEKFSENISKYPGVFRLYYANSAGDYSTASELKGAIIGAKWDATAKAVVLTYKGELSNGHYAVEPWGWAMTTDPVLTEAPSFKVTTATDATMSLSTTKVISSANTDPEKSAKEYQLVNGSFTVVKGLENAAYKVDVADGTAVNQGIDAKGGQFSFYLPTDLSPDDVTVSAYLEVDTGKTPVEIASKDIQVRYNVETTPTKLEFAYTGEQNPVAITGKVTNRQGEPVGGVKVTLNGVTHASNKYFGDGAVVTNAKGEFGYVVLKWENAEKLALTLTKDGVFSEKHADGEITARTATLKVTPSTGVVHSLADVKLTVSGSGFAQASALTSLELYEGTKVDETKKQTISGTPVVKDGAFEDTEITWTKPTKAGTYTLFAVAGNYSASATITVVNPANYNLIDSSKLTELVVGANQLKFATDEIHLVNNTGALAPAAAEDTTAKYVYTVYVDGKLAKNAAGDPFKQQDTGVVTITPKGLTTYAIRVVVDIETTKGTDITYTKVFDQTYTAKVNGLDVEVDVKTLVVNQKQTITFVVKDANGVPVNNAIVKFDGVEKVNPATVNVQNGTYIVKDFTPKAVKPIKVSIVERTKDAEATLTLDVVGDQVYTVSADVASLLQGTGEKVKFTVTKDGVAVMPQRVKLVYDKIDAVDLYPTYLGDGVSEVTINAAEAGELTVRVENFDGTLCGETTLEVAAPTLVLIDEEVANLTNNLKTEVNFKVIDPRDDSVLKGNLDLVVNEFAAVDVYDANGGVMGTTIIGGEEHALTILPKVVKAEWDKAAEDEKTVKVTFKLGATLVDGAFEVKNATITSDPEMIIIGGKNNLTLTYEDANGNPIVGKTVKVVDGSDLGKTDDKGQVVYPAGVVAAEVKLEAATDTDVKVTKTIKIGYDFEAPKVTWELDGNKANIVISDNVRLVRINIDGEEIDFWPGAKYEFVRTLQPGVNKFNIKAQDSNDNVFNEEVEIELVSENTVLKGDQVARQGEYTFVQLRQFENLGAEMVWDGEARTATFVVGETTVVLTIGSTTAMVNGEAKTMPAAAYINAELGRTYVPVRFVSESLGWTVNWAQGDVITIILP